MQIYTFNEKHNFNQADFYEYLKEFNSDENYKVDRFNKLTENLSLKLGYRKPETPDEELIRKTLSDINPNKNYRLWTMVIVSLSLLIQIGLWLIDRLCKK